MSSNCRGQARAVHRTTGILSPHPPARSLRGRL